MKYKLLIWDFDGTLADTLRLALAVSNRLAHKYGFVSISDPQSVRDLNMRDFLKAHRVPATRVPFAFAAFLSELKSTSKSVLLNDGVGPVVRQLAQHGFQQAVGSSNDTDVIRNCLMSNYVLQHFDFVSGMSRIFGKERRIRTALRHFGHDASDALYVGDEIRDIEAARAVEMDIAAVTWGLNSIEALRAHQPQFLIEHPDKLMDCVLKSLA